MNFNDCKTWDSSNRSEETVRAYIESLAHDQNGLPEYSECCKYDPSCGNYFNHKPAPYYKRGLGAVRFNTYPSGHLPGRSDRRHRMRDSNYIGPGTQELQLYLHGYPPMSLSDVCAMLHDAGYSLGRNIADNISADISLGKNLERVVALGEPVKNIRLANALVKARDKFNSDGSSGSGGATLAEMKASGQWAARRPAYERMLTSLRRSNLGLDFGFLEEFWVPSLGTFDLNML